MPLWNPHISAGRPFLANAQSAIFSPFSRAVYVLPFWRALAAMAALKLFVAAFGTYALGRVLGMRFGGALLAGVVFAFGTFFIVWLAWPLTNIFPLLPWSCCPELLVRRPAAAGAGLAGLVALTYFGGHPETTFHVMFATIVSSSSAWAARAQRGLRPSLVRPTVTFGGPLVVGTAIAAVMLLPFFELLLNSGDLDRRTTRARGLAAASTSARCSCTDYWGRADPARTIDAVHAVSAAGTRAG